MSVVTKCGGNIIDCPSSQYENTAPSGKSRTQIRLVSNAEERLMAVAVRSAVHLSGDEGRYHDYFDGNDHCASILLAFRDGDPAGTIRCRWFADFARVEKLAIRQRYRSFGVLNALVEAALRLCVTKGYRTVSGLALMEVVPFWQRKGAFTPGKAFDTIYGRVAPLIGTPREYPDIDPIRIDLAGGEAFERRVYDWEGVGF